MEQMQVLAFAITGVIGTLAVVGIIAYVVAAHIDKRRGRHS